MSLEREKEGCSLMDIPKPTAPVDPESPPPPYSSLIFTEAMPMPHGTTSCPMEDRKTMPQSVYATTAYVPMPGVQPVNEPALPNNRNVIMSRNSSGMKSRGCSCRTIFISIVVILIVFGVVVSMYKNSPGYKAAQRVKTEEEKQAYEKWVEMVRQQARQNFIDQFHGRIVFKEKRSLTYHSTPK